MARIALILPRLSRYGGVEQFAFRLAEALAETRNSEHEVEFICARSECLPPVGVRTHIVGRPGGLKFIKMLWFLIRAEQVRKRGNYDLVISLGKTWNQDMMRVGGGPQKTFWELSEKAWPAGFSRWFKHLRRRLLPSNWLTRIIDNHQYRSGCRIICVSDAVRHWTQKAYPGIPVPEVIYNLPDLSHRHRDQQFRPQGHGDPYPFRGDASRDCASVHRRGAGFRALPAACEKARRGRAYPFSRQGGGHARVVPGNGSVRPAFVL